MSGARPVLPQRVYVDTALSGTTPTALTRSSLQSLKTTVSVASGSAKAQLVYGYSPRNGSKWPWGLRAMDDIQVQALASARPAQPDATNRAVIWTGKLDAVTISEQPDAGFRVQLDASTLFKVFEATTETLQQYNQRLQWANRPGLDVVRDAMAACGIPRTMLFPETNAADVRTSVYPLAQVDPTALPEYNPQYMNWASIVASVAAMSGHEFWTDEAGYVRYRLSNYDAGAWDTIPAARLLSTSVTLNTDDGMVTQVLVRWGPQSTGPNTSQQAVAGPPGSLDVPHYHDRVLILPAPWILDQASAQWYADWVLSWASHNTRPAVVATAFWPQVRCGEVVQLPWPGDDQMLYYVSSVVHDVRVGGPAVTVLGLTYGRPLDVTWFAEAPPDTFGQPRPTVTAAEALPQGDDWTITWYDTVGLNQYSDANGTYLITAYGAKLYQSGWTLPTGGQQLTYGNRRPCAFDPAYVVPELGVSLTAGDVLRLGDGTLLDLRDTGSLVKGRHLDVFFWSPTDAGVPPATPQTVTYLNVARLGTYGLLPTGLAGPPAPAGATPALPGPPPGGNGDPVLATMAKQVAAILRIGSGGEYNTCAYAPPTPPLADDDMRSLGAFCQANNGQLPPNVQCVLFVRYLLRQRGTYPAPKPWPTGASTGDVLGQAGWVEVTGKLPLQGDVIFWQSTTFNGAGHVAIITDVLPPSGTAAGSVTWAQANSPTTLQQATLGVTSGNYWIPNTSAGPYNTTPRWMRYPGTS